MMQPWVVVLFVVDVVAASIGVFLLVFGRHDRTVRSMGWMALGFSLLSIAILFARVVPA